MSTMRCDTIHPGANKKDCVHPEAALNKPLSQPCCSHQAASCKPSLRIGPSSVICRAGAVCWKPRLDLRQRSCIGGAVPRPAYCASGRAVARPAWCTAGAADVGTVCDAKAAGEDCCCNIALHCSIAMVGSDRWAVPLHLADTCWVLLLCHCQCRRLPAAQANRVTHTTPALEHRDTHEQRWAHKVAVCEACSAAQLHVCSVPRACAPSA